MPNTRILLWVALALMVFYNYQAWMHDYPALGPQSSAAAPQAQLGDDTPSVVPTTPAPAPVPAAPAPNAAEPTTPPAPAAAAPSGGGALIQVRTDVLDVLINLKGGELDQADLLKYPLHKDQPNTPVRLLSREPPESLYVLQSGLSATDGMEAPTRAAQFSAPQELFTLADGNSEIKVPLTWQDGTGLKVTKTFVFVRGQYAIDLIYGIDNGGTGARKFVSTSEILRHWEHPSRSYFDVETYSFKGPAVYDGSKSRDLNVESSDDSKFEQVITNGWLASLQHQFVSAIVPPSGQPYRYTLEVRDKRYLLSASGPEIAVAAGGKVELHEKIFVGPKLQSQLSAAGPHLERTVDFGILTVLAQPLFTGLNWVHGIVGNWGWAIIIVTTLIKLIFYPLSQASGRSMAKMRTVAPRVKQIQETFKDDREKLGRAMMELYKKEKINPLAGCLPMIVQIPVFISFYRVLLESVEMRQAPFMLWVNDLSSRDPYFIFPAIMGGAMYAQFKLNPPPPDPTQAKIMQFMPLIMTVMMAWFPSGLVLYWLTNTLLTILQQWRINQVIEAQSKPRN